MSTEEYGQYRALFPECEEGLHEECGRTCSDRSACCRCTCGCHQEGGTSS